jgi:hypothetical protein
MTDQEQPQLESFEDILASEMVIEANSYTTADWRNIIRGNTPPQMFLRTMLRAFHTQTKGGFQDRREFFESTMKGMMDDPGMRHLANFLALSDEAWETLMSVVETFEEIDKKNKGKLILSDASEN